MTYVLRDYQQEAVSKVVEWCSMPRRGGGVISTPTGSGKTLIIAEVTRQLNRHTLIICNNQELVKQDVEKLKRFVDPSDVGIYSASLKSKEIGRYTVGTIKSIANHSDLFSHFGLIIVDECDCFISEHKSFSALLLKKSPTAHLIGLTATPYRLLIDQQFYSGTMYLTVSIEMLTKFNPWNNIIYCLNNWDLIKKGHILPVKVLRSDEFVPLGRVKQNSTDFDISHYQSLFFKSEPVALNIISGLTEEHKGVVVFCTSVEQAQRLSEQFNIKNQGVDLFSKSVYLSGYIHAKTSKSERLEIIDKFKTGKMSVLFNVNILTRGFDYEGLDCVVLLRPTKSLGLYTQMVGRVMRPFTGKDFGKLVDLTGTTKLLGRVEYSQVKKVGGQWSLWVGDSQNIKRLDGTVMYEFERSIN